LLTGQREIATLAALLLGALLGFLPYNFYPARIFLGDSGSLWLGFVLAALVLRGTARSAGVVSITAPVILGLPLVEALVTLLRRWSAGQPLLPGDRGHFHHKLLELGLSQRQAVLRLYTVGLVFAVSGLVLLRARLWLTLGVLLLLGLGIVWGVRALPYVEFRRDRSAR
jgi:UDP-GlcNAc:undecaprenyl-phosphate GlcNAc-1-phosphate transferase